MTSIGWRTGLNNQRSTASEHAPIYGSMEM